MVSARRIGHLGGWAVAWVGALSLGLGLGAPGVAHADTGPDSRATEADSEARAVDDGRSARGEVGTASVRRPQVTVGARVGGRVGGRIDTVADSLADPLRKSLDRARASTAPRLSPAAKPGAAEFEAEQVDRLQKMLRPRKTAAVRSDEVTEPDRAAATTDLPPAPEPGVAATTPGPTAAPAPMAIVEPDAVSERSGPDWSGPQWSPNPFRPDDPAPFSMPPLLHDTEKTFVALFPEIFQPFAREGFEAAYRGSQVVPWVNVVVPATEIVQHLPALLGGDDDAKRAMQVVINELLLTTQPVAVAYYGYDQIADLLNVEYPAQQAKEWFYTTAWDTLDWFELLHVRGESGLRDGVS